MKTYSKRFHCVYKYILICFLFLFGSVVTSFSQTVITGRVLNKSNTALPDVSVMLLLPRDSAVVSYAFTNKNGYYKLAYKGQSKHLLITIIAFNVKQQTKYLENRNQKVNFNAQESCIVLKEVVVNPVKMWGVKDTINYSVAAFKDKNDIVIGDLLKKIPGIDVKQNGQINYRGRGINKFYIENLDMLQGRYGIATNNIPVNDIATVQVLENHQPIKALEKTEFSNDAAINLKIKKEKKGIFGMNVILGLGVDKKVLWNEELNGMYFAKKCQHLFTYKTNNNGTDISKELSPFINNKPIGSLQMTNVQQPSTPSIRFERYNFNTSHAATASNIFKLKNDAEVNANIIYFNNKDQRKSFSKTSYILPEQDTKIIEENISVQNKTNRLEAEFRYNLNKVHNYFNSYLNFSGNWTEATGEVNAHQLIGQRLDNKSFSVNNITHWIKRGETEKGVELILKNAYKTQPHNLNIIPGLYPDRINNGKEYAALMQNVRCNAFVSNSKFSFLSALVLGNVQINPTANVDVVHQTLSTDMEAMDNKNKSHPVFNSEMRNDLTRTRINAGVSLNGVYGSSKLKINFYMPVTYRYTAMNNQLLRSKVLDVDKFYFQPSFTAQYKFSNQWETNVQGGYYTQSPALMSLYTGYVLQNYRSLNRYDTQLFDSHNLSTSFNFSYKNIFSMFFVGGGFSFNRYHSDGLYAQSFDELLSVTQIVMQPNSGSSFTVKARMSKGFNWKSLLFSADASYGESTSEQMRQSKIVNYKSQWINANASVNLRPISWLLTEYKVSWGCNKGWVESGEHFKPIQSLAHRAKADIFLPLGINLKCSLEQYYNNAIQGDGKNFLLADLGLNYVKKGVRYSLDFTNIFNTEKYVSASYGALNSYYSEYSILPRAIMLKVRFKLL